MILISALLRALGFFIGTEMALIEAQIILKGHKQDSMARHSLLQVTIL